MKKGVIYIFLLLFPAFTLSAQDVSISASFDSTRIYIGDQINFTINVEQPSDLKLNFPSFKDTIAKNIEIISGPETDSADLGNGRLRIVEKYRVTSFDSGYYQVDPMYAEAKNPDGLKRFFSDYSRLEVLKYRVAPQDTTAKIYDIIGPYKAPLTAGEIIPWALAALVAGALAWFLIVYIKKHRRQKSGKEIIVNPDPAHVIAFRELEKLKSEELWQKGHYKHYYTRLTEILRQYLENRYRVWSLELTTYETLEALLKTGFRKDKEYERLKSVLTAADLVKFAKYVPSNEENEIHFKNSWDFVDDTKEVVIQGDQVPAADQNKEEGV
ncbi:MAG: hypothetical protein ACM3UT_09825 [Chloroflexota bacterium]